MQPIPRRLPRCILEGETFEPGGTYVSLLDPEGNRKDYCPNCWEKRAKPREGHFWKGTIPLKKEKMIPPDVKALELFRTLSDPQMRFVLALYLQRKHQIVRRTQTLYEVPETGEVFDVPRVILSAQEGERLAQTLDQLLHAPLSQ